MNGMVLGLLQAAPQGSPTQVIVQFLVPFALIIVIFYFLLWRPQAKQQEKHRSMVSALKKGDSVIVAGGIYGKVAEVLEGALLVEIADKVKVKVSKNAVVGLVLPDGKVEGKVDKQDGT